MKAHWRGLARGVLGIAQFLRARSACHPIVRSTSAAGLKLWSSSAAIFRNQIHVFAGWAVPAGFLLAVIAKEHVDGCISTLPTRGAKGSLVAVLVVERLLEAHLLF